MSKAKCRSNWVVNIKKALFFLLIITDRLKERQADSQTDLAVKLTPPFGFWGST